MMKKGLKEKIDRWIEFSVSIRNLYLKIIKHEQDGNYDEEYKNILYLLPSAIEIEKKIIDELNINENNWRPIKTIIDCPDDCLVQILEEETSSFEVLRRSNILDDILLHRYNNFFSKTTPSNIFEVISNTNYEDELNNLKYADAFLKSVNVNFIAMLEKYINETEDKVVRDYLIYIKYATISTTPSYESTFAKFQGQTLPTININTNFGEIDGFSEEGINDLNRHNLKVGLVSDLTQAFTIDNNIIDEPSEKKLLYRILALNKARLISFRDDAFVTEMENAIDDIRPTNPDYSRVNAHIDAMFKDAHELVKKDYYIAKKVRK